MNVKEVKESLPYLFQIGLTPLLIGPHGVGKSAGVKQYAQEHNMEFIDLRLGTMEVGDLIGLADFEVDADGNKISTQFFRPNWFPTDPDSRGVLFLDEINRANRDVLQAVFQLVYDRQLHDKVLPKGWQIVAASNPNTDDYTVTDISDKAFADRFCHIKVNYDADQWIEYAKSAKFNDSVIGFIANDKTMLSGEISQFDINYVKPSGRSYEFLSKLMNLDSDKNIIKELAKGIIGPSETILFFEFLEKEEKPVSGLDVLENFKKVKDKLLEQIESDNPRLDMINRTTQDTIDTLSGLINDNKLKDKHSNNLVELTLILPKDIAYYLLSTLTTDSRYFEFVVSFSENEKLLKLIDTFDAVKDK